VCAFVRVNGLKHGRPGIPLGMTNHPTDHPTEPDVVYVQPSTEPANVIVSQGRKGPSFLTGIIVAVVVAVIGIIAFLVVSDSDDDGNIDVNVPSVEVEPDPGG
jgi:hypothetical protein